MLKWISQSSAWTSCCSFFARLRVIGPLMTWAGAGIVGVEVGTELEGACLVGMSWSVRHYFNDPNYIVEYSKQVRTRRLRRNHNQRRQNIKVGWANYEGEVVRSEEIQLEQETVAPSQVWREKIVLHEEEAPPEPPSTPSSESQDNWEHKESRSEDLKTPNAVPRGKLGSYHFPFYYLLYLKKLF